jgi:signal transduction histidine kinase
VSAQSTNIAWERWDRVLSTWIPYLGLVISATLSLIQSGQTWGERGSTVALVALAGAWVFVMHTRAPEPRNVHTGRMIVYFAGLLALGAALMIRQPIFFVFAITGFFHAALLRPWPLMALGIAATSILINTITSGFPWPTSDLWVLFGTIIGIQTAAISFGTIMSDRMTRLSEQRRQAVAKLEAALEENAGLHAQLLTQAREAGVLDERQRMAREIHDTVAQGLTGIITQLEAADHAARNFDQLRRHLDEARALARSSLTEARRSVQALQPEPLETIPLPEAIATMSQQWAGATGIELRFETTGVPQPLLSEIETTLFRIAQESLANVAKHAHAARVGVTLSYMDDVAVLDVRDDGIGFVLEEAQHRAQTNGEHGFGLRGMEQRLQRVAGNLSIESAPGEGTAISASVPAISAYPDNHQGTKA